MRLTFNVLCFEDNDVFAEETLDFLEGIIEEQGYYLNRVGILDNGDSLDKIIGDINARKLDVDLILMDYKLAGDVKGNVLVEKIRKNDLLTDILFYSQEKDFLQDIKTLFGVYPDGIYISGKDSVRAKAQDVIKHILKKVMDLSHFRGLVMAETSEMDDLMSRVILTLLSKDFLKDPIKEKEGIRKKILENSEDRELKIKKLNLSSDDDTLNLITGMEAAHRARTLMHLLKTTRGETERQIAGLAGKEEVMEQLGGISFEFEDFRKKILEPRNMLAHVKESKDEKNHKILESKKRNRVNFIFDDQKALEIRKDLKKYYEGLVNLYKIVSGQEWD